MPTVFFTTERLRVDRLVEKDLPEFFDLQGNPAVMRFIGKPPQRESEARQELKQLALSYDNPENTFHIYAVRLRSAGKLLGTCALIRNLDQEWEIGFRIREKFWGKGYGTEVVDGLIRFALDQPHIPEIVAYVFQENTASVRILDRHMELVRTYFNEEHKLWDRIYRKQRAL